MGRWGAAGILAILMMATTRAGAEPTAAEKETARALMSEGRDLRERSDFKSALKRFRAADAIMHVPTTALEVARTETALGLFVEARETLRNLARLPEDPSDPAPFREARAQADKLDEELQRRIGTIRFDVRAAPGDPEPTIVVDGAPILSAVIGVPFRLNPGHHAIVGRVGTKEIAQTIDAREGETIPVVLDFRRIDAPSERPRAESQATSDRPWGTVTYVGFGVAAAGVALGAASGALALTSKKAAERGCVAGDCPPSTWPDLDRMDTYARVSTVSFLVGGVGAAAGVASLLLRPAGAGSSASRPAVRIAPTARGFAVAGEF